MAFSRSAILPRLLGQVFVVNSAVPFYDFTINSTNNPSVQLITSNLTISQVLTLNGGVLDAATNSLTVIVTNNATGAIVRTRGFVTGNLERAFFGGDLYNFPVGTGTNEYSPVNSILLQVVFPIPR